MARDLTAAWDFLTAAARARQRLATARPLIWDKARLPTAEHAVILRTSPAVGRERAPDTAEPEQITIRISLETHLTDGRRLLSCLDLVAGARRWQALSYISLGDAAGQLLWEGQAIDRDDSAGFADAIDAAAYGLLEATMSLDFAAIQGS